MAFDYKTTLEKIAIPHTLMRALTPFLNLFHIVRIVLELSPSFLLVGVEEVCRRRVSWFKRLRPRTYFKISISGILTGHVSKTYHAGYQRTYDWVQHKPWLSQGQCQTREPENQT